jgi:hypothetical protein
MELWGVTMVRDEIDILPYTITHLFNEGLDHFIVADNRSVDGTREWLLNATTTFPLLVVNDEIVGYHQAKKMTALLHEAVTLGADWVIPFDADELWYDAEGITVKERIEQGWDTDLLEIGQWVHYTTSGDDQNEPNPFLRMPYRDPEMSRLSKVIVRAADDVALTQGNHQARAERPLNIIRPPIQIEHFPWRGPEHYERKIRNGIEAYDAAPEQSVYEAQHWRAPARVLREQGPAALREMYFRNCHDLPGLEYHPAPWRDTKA